MLNSGTLKDIKEGEKDGIFKCYKLMSIGRGGIAQNPCQAVADLKI